MRRNLLLVTTAFPSRNLTEEAFVLPEIESLSRHFDKVLIVPMLDSGQSIAIDWPNVEVDFSVAKKMACRFKLSKLKRLVTPAVIKSSPAVIAESKSLKNFFEKSFFIANSHLLSKLFNKLCRCHGLSLTDTVFYTFWFDHATSALVEMAGGDERVRIVSRAHGHDVYDLVTGQNRFRRLRELTLQRITSLYPVSAAGADYLNRLYPGHRDKMHLRPLGSQKPLRDAIAKCHTDADNRLTFFSTARVAPEKRVSKNLDLVIEVAHKFPDKLITWIHVGDGPLMSRLEDKCATERLPDNLTVKLLGALPNEKVHQIYMSETIDFFILLSSSEGSPVSICESLSYGVPVIATNVGGVGDMFSPCEGLLVDENSSPADIAASLVAIVNDRQRYLAMKSAAFSRWSSCYDSEALREDFSKELASLLP